MRETVYQAIVDHVDRYRASPTIRELVEATGACSTSVVLYHLRSLAQEGRIERGADGSSRSIRVVGNLASNTAQEGAQIARQVLADAEPLAGDGMDETPIHAIVSTELLDRLQRWTERVGA